MAPSKLFKLKNEPQNPNIKKKFMSNEPSDNICYDFAAKLLSNLNLLRRDKRFCDVEIKLGNKIFSAHRAILSASSPYFHAMFTGELCEKDQKCVELHGLHPNTLDLILDFMYSGIIVVNKDNVEDLVIAADMFEIVEIITECTYFLIDQLHETNAIGIYLKWSKVPDMTVNRLVPGVASLNGHIYVVGGEEGSNILSSCERYDPVMKTWTEVASMLISRCEFGLCALDGYLYAMGGWVDTDISGSIERYDPRMDKWELVGNLSEPRFSMGLVSYEGLIYMVGGCSLNQRNMQDLMSYNPVTGEWQKLPSMSVARFQMGVAVLDDYLYVVGGTHRQLVLNSVERYSFKKNKWETVPAMKLERSGPAVSAMDGFLYVIGGAQIHATPFYRAQCTISAVECFDPYTNTWSDCPPLSETRAEAGAVVI